MGELRKLEPVLRHVEDVRVYVDVVYPERIDVKDLLELDFGAAEV